MSQPELEVAVLPGRTLAPPERLRQITDSLAGLAYRLRIVGWPAGAVGGAAVPAQAASTPATANPALGEVLADGDKAAPFVLILGQGAVPLAGAVAAMREALRARPRAGVAGGLVLNERGSFRASFAAFPSLGRELLSTSGLGQRLYGPWFPSHSLSESAELCATDWVSGVCLLIRREALALAGLFDPQLAEPDTTIEWCYRLRRAGRDVLYVPGATVVCADNSPGLDLRSLVAGYRSRVRLIRRTRGPLAATGLKLALAA
ncbi:MAG: glycosyltransferase family 2 protein, partial [Chloroflexales bacterium]|nr:glycosyltransferase family 2 protein [Chloroflexales bacterium]